jgi:muramoyltetrapeptide carboxypeptidase
MLMAGKFDGVTGVVFGEMLGCVPAGQTPEVLERMILRVLDRVDGPVAIGLRSGHVSRCCVTLAFGIQAELDLSDEPTLSFLEPATNA